MVSAMPPSSVRIVTDLAHGGRWTSLRAGDREWLWCRDEPRRADVRPGDAFADAGGIEECLPTVRGVPDHGDVWSRPWRREGGTECVDHPDFRLARRIGTGPGGAAVVDYRLNAAPGFRFLWAAHALLDLAEGARIVLPDGARGRLYPDGGANWSPFDWPHADPAPEQAWDVLGSDDGTAVGAIVEAGAVTVADGPDRLRFALDVAGQPAAVALWRNLRGFPEGAPYRSIGVEPMLGRVFDLAAAGERDAACVPAGGEVRWRLTVTHSRAV
ncbi:hypothetical protein SAMN05216251_113125 [Actinacidiphila alni]|uniref:Aldose epimerase n=2 Tax=Actinacidiphila alni TaxID=380248 RepID=A0A1I2IE08_9ACTN|nr:hypothetical protein SAMN05216251_113125 [Actinacidiphila alni]